MNQDQEVHVKAIAHKMRILAEIIVERMKYVEDLDIVRYSIGEIETYLKDSLFYCDVIRNTYNDMHSELPREG